MYKSNTKILIVDDMATMRKIVSKTLREFGFSDIQEGTDGLMGWDILSKAEPPFELIISDWNMPNLTGIELLKKVRANEKYANTPFILLTAEAEAAQVSEALKLGVSNYIVKPFSPDMLRQKLLATYTKTKIS